MTVTEPHKRGRLPGVDGVWVFIGADAVIFALLFFSFMKDRYAEPALFESARRTLNFSLAGADTLLLITSSWLVALAVRAAKLGVSAGTPRLLFGGALTGLLFAISKSVEYGEKFSAGITPATNGFFMWYFALTGIHLLHVLVGTALLGYVWTRTRRAVFLPRDSTVLECVASFWHLVDLLWIVLFPLLYLQR
ncbi:cytochrome c oxidase subunit 3 [Saccharopolyspora sp. SCSIO 74807]|uniref:cytochrome c oxidase subunit 3 n=1 Tax=Saccharopolyspora sp. SCSIO 74807 TaxID=3118084 RepID=UPI0030CCD639